jgi:HK97 family phage major capsid protein
MFKFQNSKRRLARHPGIVKWGAFALLAVTAVAMCAGYMEAGHHLPSFASLAEIGGSGTLFALPALIGYAYEGKDEFERAVLSAVRSQGAEIDELNRKLLEVRKNHVSLASRGATSVAVPNQVSNACARHLGLLAVLVNLPRITDPRSRDIATSEAKNVLGAEWRAAITPSDIPLPVGYSGEIVELVSRYGRARQYGTVFPLSTGTVKLPRLTTDPNFGLIAMSATVPEKSPQVAWVTFNAEKFGGLVRMPSEINEDSIVPIGQFLARYAARQLAYVEDYNFFLSTGAGSGVNGSVAGLCFSVITNSKIVQMASTKTHYSDATLANLRALRAVPDEAALYEAAYYMHPTFEGLLSTFNTAGDRPYNPNAQLAGASGAQPLVTTPTLDGFPIRWVNVMPAYSTAVNLSKVFILFGDPSYQYLGLRGGISFASSEHAGFTTDEILIRALERFTIGQMAPGSIAGLETAAS